MMLPPPALEGMGVPPEDRVLVRVDSQADLHRLLSVLNGHGPRLVSVTPARQSLEDLFIREARAASPRKVEPSEAHAHAG